MKKNTFAMLAVVALTYTSVAQNASIKNCPVTGETIHYNDISKIKELEVKDSKGEKVNYKIVSFKVMLKHNNDDGKAVILQSSNMEKEAKFSKEALNDLSHAKSGDVIYVEEIKAINSENKEIAIPAIRLTVTK